MAKSLIKSVQQACEVVQCDGFINVAGVYVRPSSVVRIEPLGDRRFRFVLVDGHVIETNPQVSGDAGHLLGDVFDLADFPGKFRPPPPAPPAAFVQTSDDRIGYLGGDGLFEELVSLADFEGDPQYAAYRVAPGFTYDAAVGLVYFLLEYLDDDAMQQCSALLTLNVETGAVQRIGETYAGVEHASTLPRPRHLEHVDPPHGDPIARLNAVHWMPDAGGGGTDPPRVYRFDAAGNLVTSWQITADGAGTRIENLYRMHAANVNTLLFPRDNGDGTTDLLYAGGEDSSGGDIQAFQWTGPHAVHSLEGVHMNVNSVVMLGERQSDGRPVLLDDYDNELWVAPPEWDDVRGIGTFTTLDIQKVDAEGNDVGPLAHFVSIEYGQAPLQSYVVTVDLTSGEIVRDIKVDSNIELHSVRALYY